MISSGHCVSLGLMVGDGVELRVAEGLGVGESVGTGEGVPVAMTVGRAFTAVQAESDNARPTKIRTSTIGIALPE